MKVKKPLRQIVEKIFEESEISKMTDMLAFPTFRVQR